jgi:RHH-type rel operon transcriptional repressor/antitoxin RelB
MNFKPLVLGEIHAAGDTRSTKARLQQLAKSTGRSRAFLAAEAIEEYLDINECHVAGVLGAIASLYRGKGLPHQRVKEWVTS